MFFGSRRNNYNKIVGEEPIEGASSTSYSGSSNPAGFSIPSSSSSGGLPNKTHSQQNFVSYTNEMDGSHSDMNYLDSLRPPSFHQGVSVTINTGKSTPLNRSKQAHRWDHIEDLDQFFTLIYEYHQGNGFTCIALRHAFALFQFVFVVLFSTFLLQFLDYQVMFNQKNTTSGELVYGKRQIHDAIIPFRQVHFNLLTCLALFLAAIFWLIHLVRTTYRLLQLWEIKAFFGQMLEIPDAELSNVLWQEVVCRLCKLQPELHLIINQEQITPLDVYQRILRHKNYFVALVYDNILPQQISFPALGSTYYLSTGLKFNLEWLFFWGPWALWKGSYALKDEYKNAENLENLAIKMRQTITWISFVNFLFFPFIFLYQVLFSFFSYADLVKREPGVFGTRKYSNYGRDKLRHFNELDHELESRLNRSYGFAVRYMEQFISPANEIIAKTITFTCGSVFAVLLILSAWDEDVLNMEHILTVMTVCGAIVMICRSFIANENLVFCQEFLMKQIIANIHYAPKSWLKEAHSTEVYKDFSQIFQLKAQYLAEELLSPMITPFVLFFCIRPKAHDIIQFFYKNTQSVEGVGDVCSYSLMDVNRYGDKRLASLNQSIIEADPLSKDTGAPNKLPSDQQCGKIELSLVNFALMNPTWQPPKAGADFIQNLKEKVVEETIQQPNNDSIFPLQASFQELENSINIPQSATNWALRPNLDGSQMDNSFVQRRATEQNSSRILESVNQSQLQQSTFSNSLLKQMPFGAFYQPKNVQENTSRALEMSMNALALNRMLASSNYGAHLQRGIYNNNNSNPQQQQQQASQNLLLTSRFGGYGTLGLLDSTQPPPPPPTTMGSMFGLGLGAAGPPMSNISSNLFDVPDDEEEEEEDVPMQGFGHQLGSPSRHNNSP